MTVPPSNDPARLPVSLEAQIAFIQAEIQQLLHIYAEWEVPQELATLRAVVQTLETLRQENMP